MWNDFVTKLMKVHWSHPPPPKNGFDGSVSQSIFQQIAKVDKQQTFAAD